MTIKLNMGMFIIFDVLNLNINIKTKTYTQLIFAIEFLELTY